MLCRATQDHLVLIAALVSLFPNVSRLTLRHFPFSDTLRITLVSSYISSTAESGLLFSGFSPFVAFLRATQVLALEHRPACEPLVFGSRAKVPRATLTPRRSGCCARSLGGVGALVEVLCRRGGRGRS